MQRFTAKEVKPSPGENKPTVIKTEDGSSLSGFSASLKDMKPGTVFECETEIKKGYVNIKGEPVIIQTGNGQAAAVLTTGNGYRKEDPAKIASIETQVAAKIISELWVADKLSEDKPEDARLMDQLLAWCNARIPNPGQKGEVTAVGAKERTQIPPSSGSAHGLAPPTPPDGPEHFENRGQLFTACQKYLGVGPKGICEVLGITDPKNIIDLDEAYQAVKNSINK